MQMRLQWVTKAGNIRVWIADNCPWNFKLSDQPQEKQDGRTYPAVSVARRVEGGWPNDGTVVLRLRQLACTPQQTLWQWWWTVGSRIYKFYMAITKQVWSFPFHNTYRGVLISNSMDLSQSCQTIDTAPVHDTVCLFTLKLMLQVT